MKQKVVPDWLLPQSNVTSKARRLERMDGNPAGLRVCSWNLAAVNNNPFEYWITHDDTRYDALMVSVQEFIDGPGDRDVTVSEVFTPSMMADLARIMADCGWGSAVEATAQLYETQYKDRPIISGFMKDEEIGLKRLMSMPDRFTNTVNTADKGTVCRPTVINLFEQPLGSLESWWGQWKAFMFETQVCIKAGESVPIYSLLEPIKSSKYPAISKEEEEISLPLQTMCLAIFDAILVHIMNSHTGMPPGVWHEIKLSLCEALNKKKTEHTLQILSDTYADMDVIFLQEAAAVFLTQTAGTALESRYHFLVPAQLDGKRDQNSMILCSKERFYEGGTEITDAVIARLPEKAPVAAGDLFVVSLTDKDGTHFVLASFHGDTNGLATVPVVRALADEVSTRGEPTLLLGLDANAHFQGKPGKKLGASEFLDFLRTVRLTSCFGESVQASDLTHTTFNSRTILQPQLQKAVRLTERETSELTDRHPKDYILFTAGRLVPSDVGSDNTGSRDFVHDAPFPTMKFPSDHAVLRCTLNFPATAEATAKATGKAKKTVPASGDASKSKTKPAKTFTASDGTVFATRKEWRKYEVRTQATESTA